MLITCLRHATAESHTDPISDAERVLVKKGKDQVVRVAEFCRKHALLPAKLYSSPLRRAQQTAKLLHTHLPDCAVVEIVDWLSLGTDPQAIIAELNMLEDAGVNDVWLVGHEPTMSELVAGLINAPDDSILIKKASLTRIQVNFANGSVAQLLWSIPCGLMSLK
ncbi:MAG: phosphohistidine phosphatase SixA [Methylomonas sp.]|jgi:phosphohistidine phosphatase SixA|uniref:phosphohistidine phosphatase SixA n=1 Tax=Methylomonas sp. TaxID=418 RepID=UPI002600D4AF|nr:phosphohistidine phosphatase SixA [Methylomonas sp.]MCK9605110.1 phosphohistidine phosphatase SixA [Methylomonas sp.]